MEDITLSLIAAVDNNLGIGKGGQIPWHIPADLSMFKTRTSFHPIIMGRKTHQSIGRWLPTRHNIVLTSHREALASGVIQATDMTDAIQKARAFCKLTGNLEIFVIGGQEIYELYFPLAQRIYLTRVNADFGCDRHFPRIDDEYWSMKEFVANPFEGVDATFEVRERKLPSVSVS